MDVLSSIEVRWFLDVTGPTAAAARAVFADVPAGGKREDRYLLTCRDDISVKARIEEGAPAKVETKYLLGSLGPMRLHENLVGNVERWRKLSLTLHDNAVANDGSWVTIAKNRRLRKLAYDGTTLVPVDAKSSPPAGCAIELTELEYELRGKTRQALTVGLDVFSPNLDDARVVLDILTRACACAFDSRAALCLDAGSSESYPHWLARTMRMTSAA
jgi:hypothetical protein